MRFWFRLRDALQKALAAPVHQLNRWQFALRYAIAVSKYGIRKLGEDRAGQMAAALTYQTIFGLVPLFVLALIVFNAFGGFQSVGQDLQQKVYDYLGLNIAVAEAPAPVTKSESLTSNSASSDSSIPIKPDATDNLKDADGDPEGGPGDIVVGVGGSETTAAEDAETAAEAKRRVDDLLNNLTVRISEVSFGSIGVVGIGILVWAAVMLVVSIEYDFNRIFRAPEGRPWHLRIAIYWAVITLGPVLVAGSFYMTSQLFNKASEVVILDWAFSFLTPFASLGATWLLLFLLYRLMPNARVQFRAALGGALIAAVIWEISKWGFKLYVDKAVSYSALYGSLGLIPLFLLWLYLTWLVILFGLEVAYVVQTVPEAGLLEEKDPEPDPAEGVVDLGWVVPLAAYIGDAFRRGEAVPLHQVAADLSLPIDTVCRLVDLLKEARVIHRVDEGAEHGPGYTLSRPAQNVQLAELLRVARRLTHTEARAAAPGGDWLESLHRCTIQQYEGQTLAELCGETPTPQPPLPFDPPIRKKQRKRWRFRKETSEIE
jgi:membrane protein